MRLILLLLLLVGTATLAAQPDILYYKLDETSGALAQNNAVPGAGWQNAAISAPPVWNTTDPQVGVAALDNTGQDRRMSTGYSMDARNGQPFTIEFWFRTTSNGYQDFCNDSDSFAIWLYNGQVQCWLGRRGNNSIPQLNGATGQNDGQWRYAALTYDGVSSFNLYSGSTVGGLSAPVTATETTTFTTRAFELLHWQAASPATYSGEMDEFRLWGVEQTSGQLQADRFTPFVTQDLEVLDTLGTFVKHQGVAAVTNVPGGVPTDYTFTVRNVRTSGNVSFTPVTLPAMTGATASVISSPSTIAPGATSTFVVRVTPLQPEFTVDIDINNDRSPNPYQFTLNGMMNTGRPEMLYYRLNEGTGTLARNDASPGRGNDPSTFSTGPTWVTSGQPLGGAAAASNANLVTGFNCTQLPRPEWTLETWVRNGDNGTRSICGDGISFRIYQVSRRIWIQGGVQSVNTGYRLPNSTTTWTHLAFVSDPGSYGIRLYVNGTQEFEEVNFTFPFSSAPFTVFSNGGGTNYVGALDEFRFWSHARTSAQINADLNRELIGRLEVRRPGVIASGGTDALGSVTTGVAQNLNYTLGNIGSTGLLMGNPAITFSGQTNCSVSVPTNPSGALIAASGTAASQVTVTPLTPGAFSCQLQFASNDPDTPSYVVNVSGTAVGSPQIQLERPAASIIAHNGSDSVPGAVAGATSNLVYTIRNTGTLALNLTSEGFSANSNCNVSVAAPLSTTLAVGATTTMQVDVTPIAAGAFSFVLHVDSNDPSTPTYDVNVSDTAAPGGEIDIQRPAGVAFSIADGGTSNVAGAVAGVQSVLTFTIENLGTANLTLTSPNPAGGSAPTNCGVILIQPGLNVLTPTGANSSTTFQVRVTPIAAGAFSYQLTVASDDANEDPYNINISGSAAPGGEINVQRPVGTNIADGGTDVVGSSFVAGVGSVLTYRVFNLGTAALNISGTSLTGQTNCGAVVTSALPGSIANGGFADLQITVTPTAGGAFSFDIDINSDDVNESTYDIHVDGNSAPGGEIHIERPVGTGLADGATDNVGTSFVAGVGTVLTYRVFNQGTASLAISGVSITGLSNCAAVVTGALPSSINNGAFADLQITVTPSAGGAFSFDIDVSNNDVTENPYDIHVDGTSAPGGEIHVERPVGTSIADNATDNVGTSFVAGVGAVLTYRVFNQGTASLAISSVTFSGESNCVAVVTGALPGSINTGSFADLQITVTPAASGAFAFDFDINNDDVNENPYDIHVDGSSAPGGEIHVERPVGTSIADNATDNVGTSFVAGVGTVLTYRVFNQGTAALSISTATLSGQTNCGAVVTSALPGSIANGGFADLQITVTPAADGAFSFDIDINSDDVDESTYDIHVDGTSAPGGEIHVERPISTNIPDGGSDSLGGGHVAGVDIVLNYTVYNQGSAALAINSAGLAALVNCAANITGTLPGTIANGGQATLQVTVSPNAAGNFSFEIDIDSNDVDESNYDISVDGTAIAGGEIDIQRPAGVAFSIADGTGSDGIAPTTAGVTAFATYTIENLGTAVLTLTGQSFNTPNNCNVVVGAPALSSLNPGQTTTFQVQVTPTASGSWDFELVVTSDDVNEATYNFPVSGSAAPGGEIHVERPVGTGIADGTTDNLGTGFVAGVGSVLTYRVFNQGTATLNISSVALTGQTNCGAVVTGALPANIANGAFADLQITVTPSALGAFNFDIDINSDDVDEGTYDIHADGNAAPGGEIDIQQPALTSIANGSPQTVNGTVAGATTQLTYTVENQGTGDLTITSTGTTGALNNVGVVVGTVGSTVLTTAGAGSTTTFTVDITPSTLGAWSFTLQVTSNDTTDPSYTIAVSGTAAAGGEIDIQQPAPTSIANGGPQTVNGTVAGATTQLIYTVENQGTGDLTITGTGTTGALNNVGVVVGTVGSTVLTPTGAGSTTTFTVDITPTVLGAWSFTLQVTSNDTTDPSYTIAVDGSAAPGGEIELQRPALSPISNGGSDNVAGTVAGATTQVTYTIENTGTGDLTITGTGTTGALNNVGVIVGTVGSTVLTPAGAGSTTTFTVDITPTALGAWSFTLQVTSNDTTDPSYTINVSDTAVPGGEIHVERPVSTNIFDGGTDSTGNSHVAGVGTVLTYTVRNQGTAVLTLSGVAISNETNCAVVVTGALPGNIPNGNSAPLQLTVTPNASGSFSFDFDINSDDQDENPYDIHVVGNAAPGGEIDVQQPAGAANSIANGTPQTVNGTVAGATTQLTYTIENQGTGDLTISGTGTTGALNNVGVVVGAVGSSALTTTGPGSTTTFTVDITPTALGAWSFVLRVSSDDANENPYDINVSGTAAPGGEIQVERPVSTVILDGAPDSLTGTHVAGVGTVLNYTVRNLGTADLTITGATFSNETNCLAVVTGALPGTIANGAFAVLQVTVTPNAASTFSFDLDISSNDVDESTYDIAVDGTALAGGEINLQRPGGTTILHNGSDTVTGAVAGASTSLFYTIQNLGTADLTITGQSFNTNNNCSVTVFAPAVNPIASSGSTTLQVDVTALTAGAFDFVLQVDSDDISEPNYVINVSGNAVVGGEIHVERPVSTNIFDGGTDNTGNSHVAGVGTVLDYTVRNLGTATLSITGVAITNQSNCNAVVTGALPASIGSGSSSTLQITVTPIASGNFSFDLDINSDDLDEGTYDIHVDGSAVPGGEIELQRPAASPIANGSSDNVPGTVAGATTQVTYTIENQGTGDLTITGTGTTGALNNVGVVVGTVGSTVLSTSGAGSITTFTVDITPTALGAWSFTLQVTSDDTSDPSYTINVSDIAAPGGEIDIQQPAPTSIANGSPQTVNGTVAGATTQLIYTVENQGTGDLTITGTGTTGALNNVGVVVGTVGSTVLTPAGAGSTTTFTVDITPAALGAWSFTLQVTSDDTTDPSYTISVSGTAAAGGEIDIQQPAPTSIANGSPQTVNGTVAGATTQLTYTVENQGTGDLTITSTGTTGALNNVGVVVGTVGSTVLTPTGAGSNTTFTVDITPTALGAWSFTLQVTSNDTTDPSYTISVSGTAAAGGEIDIQRPVGVANSIPDNVGSDTVLGTIAGVTTVVTYTIENQGTATLTLTGQSFNTANNCNVVVGVPGASSLNPSQTTTLQVQVTPIAGSAWDFELVATSDDVDEGTYNFTVAGTATFREIHVDYNSSPLGNPDTVVVAPSYNGVMANVAFELRNAGNELVNLTGTPDRVNVISSSNVSATPIQPVGSSVAAAAVVPFSVDFTPTAAAAWNFVLQIDSDDPANPVWTITVSGTSFVTPVLDFTPTVSYGNHNVGTTSAALSHTLTNIGGSNLVITSISLIGADAARWSLINNPFPGPPQVNVLPAGSIPLQGQYTPNALTSHVAQIEVVSNTGGVPGTISLIDIDGNGTFGDLSSPSPVGYPAVNLGASGTPVTHTLTSSGSGPVRILNITKSGADQADWAIGSTPSYPQPLASGAFWDITGTFTPSHIGGHSAQFVIDWDEGAGTTAQQTIISVSGTGTVGSSVTNVSTGADTGGPVFVQADVNATGASFVDVAVTYTGGSNPGAATIVPQVGLTIIGNVIQNVPANTQLSFYWDAFATEGNTTAVNYVITLSPTVGATPGTPGSSPVFGLDRTTDWTKYGGINTQAAIVQPVSEAAMVHDTVNDRLIVFGGIRANALSNDVWAFEFASNTWRVVTPTGTLPSPRRLTPHTYDSVNNRMIVFGGETSTGEVNDTWALDLTAGAESWSAIATAAPLPEVRTDGTLVMDTANQRAILYGGYNAGKVLFDTWVLDLTLGSENWGGGELTTSGTPAGGSIAHCSVFDPINSEMFVFRAMDAEIWKLDFSATPTWTNLTVIGGPTARRYPTAVYDPVAHSMVIHGGVDYVGSIKTLNDTWSYDIALGTWSQLPSEPNSAGRYWHNAVYDNTRQQMVVLGGRNSAGENNNRIGVLKLTGLFAWQTPPDARPVSAGLPPRSGAVICNDFNNNRIVMFGGRTEGNVLSDLWMLDRSGSGTWVPLAANGPSPNARAFAAHTFDFVNNRLILFGGDGAGGYMNDVWVLDLPAAGTPTWSFIIGNSGPSQRRFASAAYDSSRNNLMIYGGDDGTILGDVWSLNLAAPVWNQLTPGGVPPVNRRGHGSVYDSFHDRLVIFCGDSGGVRNDVWALSLGGSPTWTDISSGQPTLPIQRWRFSSSPTSDGRNVYIGSGDLNGSLLGDFWLLDLTGVTAAWSRVGTVVLHAGRIDPVGALDNAGKLVFTTGGHNYRYTKDTYEIDLGAPALVPIAFTDKPVNLALGQTAFDPVGRRMIAYGGVIDGAPSGGLWQLDLNSTSPTWSLLSATGPSPGPLMGASFVYDGSASPPRMLLYGGRGSVLTSSSKLDLWALELDPGNEQWIKLNPTVVNNPLDRFLHTAVIDGAGHMLVMGGRNFWQHRLNNVYRLDLGTLTWSLVSTSGTPPTVREAHSAIYDGLGGRNRMIIHGGTDGFTYFNDTWELDLNTMTWSQLSTGGPTPAGTHFHTAVLDPDTGRMLLYGGGNPDSTDQFFSLDLATDTWTQISPAGPAPQSRWGHASVWDSVAHRFVLVGGYTGDNNPVYRAELTQDGGAEVDTWFWRG